MVSRVYDTIKAVGQHSGLQTLRSAALKSAAIVVYWYLCGAYMKDAHTPKYWDKEF